jgi:hypothetical protein
MHAGNEPQDAFMGSRRPAQFEPTLQMVTGEVVDVKIRAASNEQCLCEINTQTVPNSLTVKFFFEQLHLRPVQ